MTEKKDLPKKNKTNANDSMIQLLSWLIVGLCTILTVVGFTLHRNVYLPILVMVLVSTISLFNVDRANLKKSDQYNLYLAAGLDVVALILYFMQSLGML